MADVAGELDLAKAQADSILLSNPDHLLGLALPRASPSVAATLENNAGSSIASSPLSPKRWQRISTSTSVTAPTSRPRQKPVSKSDHFQASEIVHHAHDSRQPQP
jgi:hypothetical protein